MPNQPNLLDAMTHARLCAEYLMAAHWLHWGGSSARDLAEIKFAAATDQFLKLAGALGYRIEKIEAPAEREEAA